MFFLSGDFRFFYPENIKDFVSFPFAWDSSLNTGLGQSQLSTLWVTSYFNFTSFFTNFGLSWNTIEIIFWILPAIILSFFSSFSLFNYLFKSKKWAIVSGVIYLFNTYFLMILTGGQLGVSLAYSLLPLVFLRFIKFFDDPSLKNSILAGFILAFQLLFDPRFVYISLTAIFLYSIFNLQNLKKIKFYYLMVIPGITVLLNLYWILPLTLTKSLSLPEGFNSVGEFKFFSFADFSHSLSLLHPNWPENIFGKLYFLDPKFLLLPVIAFSSLLFKKNKTILFFSTLALLGVFLAKGVNGPFGEINAWIFSNFPGMSMFRDPTKWYGMVAFSYSILIPYSLLNLSGIVQTKVKVAAFKRQIPNIIFVTTFIYAIFLINPIFKQIKIGQVPQDYVHLEKFLSSQKTFSRTLWIPKWQRFGFFSNAHPAIGREELYQGGAQKQILQLNQNLLVDLSVKYIIVPYDSEGEIFIKDRMYDKSQYMNTINSLRKITWLREINGFDKIHVFEVSNTKDHFWSSSNIGINYRYISPTEYNVQVQNARKGNSLVFSEGFDRNWVARSSEFRVQSSEFRNKINSFVLPKDGNYELRVYYEPQKYVEAGIVVSLASFIGLLVFLTVKFHL